MRVRRLSHLSVNRMVPNVLTLLALCAGMTAIRFAINGQYQYATLTIIAAGIFDGLDGRLARLLKATSSFGAELDSLSDFISFGVAPAAVLYLWTMAAWHSVGWVIVLFYAVCCALRLARFNAQLATEPVPYLANFFKGAPAPAGAGLVMVPMFISFEWGDFIARSPYLNGIWISIVAVMMVSTVPTVSLKRIRVPHQMVIPTLLVIVLMIAFFTTAPWPTLTCIGLIYIVSIPLTVQAAMRAREQFEARRADATVASPVPPPAPGAQPPVTAPEIPSADDNSTPASAWRH
ncbi:MAG: CDP-diacylglycerol--serine O-phosphatidyltransferase [Alphaproteobacteria bacterium]|nr:CDP-diacylglycerol--serine O-phosphatidyltransferase [Alphaproteobacteria bacterium]